MTAGAAFLLILVSFFFASFPPRRKDNIAKRKGLTMPFLLFFPFLSYIIFAFGRKGRKKRKCEKEDRRKKIRRGGYTPFPSLFE